MRPSRLLLRPLALPSTLGAIGEVSASPMASVLCQVSRLALLGPEAVPARLRSPDEGHWQEIGP